MYSIVFTKRKRGKQQNHNDKMATATQKCFACHLPCTANKYATKTQNTKYNKYTKNTTKILHSVQVQTVCQMQQPQQKRRKLLTIAKTQSKMKRN